MSEIYEDKVGCEFCSESGFIEVYNFNHVSISNRLQWNKETRIIALKQEKICPICDGKGWLHIIKKKV